MSQLEPNRTPAPPQLPSVLGGGWRPEPLAPIQLRRDLDVRDLTDPEAGPHGIQQIVDRAVARLASAWGCDVRWVRGPRTVPIADNYDRLGFDAASVTRDARYTRYVDDAQLLRSHSTAMIPAALRELAADPVDDVLLVAPGIVYRRDAIDWQHTGTPHQLDLWRISRRAMTEADLEEMICLLTGELVPDLPWRAEARVHPYTLSGRQVDVLLDQRWVEIWECGLAHPDVLAGSGLPGWHGLALGMGLDRLFMLVTGVPDIRLLRSTDPRVSEQMLDLAPYRPVSAMPAISRDLSIAVAETEDEETLGDRVREALGADAVLIEEVQVRSATAYADLPSQAIARLGAQPGQQNLLVRVVLRDLEHTMTDDEANVIRDRVYAAVHQGTRHVWAAREP